MIAALSIACGGDDDGAGGSDGGGAPDAGGQGDLEELCASSCAHAVECGWETDQAGCVAECLTGPDMFRLDGLEAQLSCLAGLDCATDNPGETCYVETVADLEPHAVHQQYNSDCTAAATDCGGLPGDVCAIDGVIMFSDTYMEEQVMPCFELACEALRACLEENVLDAF
jgi:hypothetical protein